MAKAETVNKDGEIVPGTYSTITAEDTQVANAVLAAGQAAAELEMAKADLAKVEREIEETIELHFPHLALRRQAVLDAEAAYKTAEAELREKANAAKSLSPDRTDWFGVVVSTDKKQIYDPKAALEWCKENLPAGVRVKHELDANAFKKAAAQLEATGDIPADIFRTENTFTSRIDVSKLINFVDAVGKEE